MEHGVELMVYGAQYDAIKSVLRERKAQDEKWGVQRHYPLRWLAVLLEEVGEIGEAMNDASDLRMQEVEGRIYHEVTQVAAVAVAWLEAIHRSREERLNDNARF